MAVQVEELKNVLEEQKEVITELLELADTELETLKNDDYEKLSEITVTQEEKGQRLALLEKNRREVIANFSKELGVELEYLSDLFPYIDEEEENTLDRLAEEIKAKHSRLQEANNLNDLLLKQGLAYARRVLNCFTTKETGVYGKKGSLQEKENSLNIDKNV